MNILAVNPWIYDFAAFDFWLKPYGFLVILQYLKDQGVNASFVDCLDEKALAADYGRGKYPAVTVDKPKIFAAIPRFYKRYGISRETLQQQLAAKNPDYILMTSSMTYWYPGVLVAAKILKAAFPGVPIILGGTYATLCKDHALKQGVFDQVFANNELESFFKLLGLPYDRQALYGSLPDYFHFYPKLDYLVLRTSWGCPFNCAYCAIKQLFPDDFYRLPAEKVIAYVSNYTAQGIKDLVLYDDAFLYENAYAKDLLSEIVRRGWDIRFHTPNALHLRYLDNEIAALLKKSGFINPHFGLETLDPDRQKDWGDKISRETLLAGVETLKSAGFKNGEFSVYLLLGYPGQDLARLKEDVDYLHKLGARVSFAEFSPVPGTRMFEQYQDKFNEPLTQNNSVFGSYQEGLPDRQAGKIKEFWEIKNYLRELNRKF